MTAVSTASRVVVEADGGSRGNPGPAGFGAVLRDAATGAVIAESAESIGTASNNVAEYRGLIAGLELYAEHTPDAQLEVRMDSKLVVEQMAGRWKIRHPTLQPLAAQAAQLAPFGTVWTWVPRALNSSADRLANLAMDAAARGAVYTPQPPTPPAEPAASAPSHALLGWSGLTGAATKLVFLRHGETPHTADRRFSGRGGGDVGLTEAGVDQARRAARAVSELGGADVLVSSPLRRTRETAEAVAASLGIEIRLDEGFEECRFGEWDGLTLDEVRQGWPDLLAEWLGSPTVRPPRGESVDDVRRRVEECLLTTLDRFAGETVVVVSHVTPIKASLRYCLQAPWDVTHHMLLAPGSLTTMWFYESGASVLRSFSVVP